MSAPNASPGLLRPSLFSLASEAIASMTPDQLQLYSEILGFRDTFGAPVDVNALVRAVRKDA
jgi:hypothetical protein